MAMRNIIKIDEEKCNGCGQCATACAEGAIEIIDGKAKLVSEIYCDGLGACIGHCPQAAITVEQRDAKEFDEQATNVHVAKKKKPAAKFDFVCPGMMAKKFSNNTEQTETGQCFGGKPIRSMACAVEAGFSASGVFCRCRSALGG